MDWLLLVIALVIILGGAELFTNGVEWVGEGFGLSEGAVGSVLAAIGTALPETILPFVAIVFGHGSSGDAIGIGAILGAPVMLTTLAMFALGLTVVVYSRKGKRMPHLAHDSGVMRQDLLYFLAMFGLASLAGLIHVRALHYCLVVVLIVGYGFYVKRHFAAPGEAELEAEATGEVKPLRLWHLLKRTGKPSIAASLSQTFLGVGLIVGASDIFVHSISDISVRLGVSQLAVTLLIAPVATELPEALNASFFWARRGKDVLALGNITGAMVFQATFPVALGLAFTPWKLDLTAGVAAAVALLAAGILYLTVRLRGRLTGALLLFQGLLWVGYVIFVLARL